MKIKYLSEKKLSKKFNLHPVPFFIYSVDELVKQVTDFRDGNHTGLMKIDDTYYYGDGKNWTAYYFLRKGKFHNLAGPAAYWCYPETFSSAFYILGNEVWKKKFKKIRRWCKENGINCKDPKAFTEEDELLLRMKWF